MTLGASGATRRLRAVLVLTVAASACIRAGGGGISASVPIPTSVVAESSNIQHAVPAREGQLTQSELAAIAPHIRALRADPEELFHEVGDTIRVSALVRVLAIDSAGTVLGELPVYDFGYRGRGFRLLRDGRLYVGRRGTLWFRATLPAEYWQGSVSTRPTAEVALQVQAGARR